MRAALAMGLLGVVALGSMGCADDFVPYNRLTSLRVLAIKSEPANPSTGETATLSAKVFLRAALPSTDGGVPDGGDPDGGDPDGGDLDGGTPDGGDPDGGTSDGGDPDAGAADGGAGVGPTPGVPGVTYRWSWCPVPGASIDGYEPCQISHDELVALAGGVSIPPYDLGSDPTASFPHTVPPELLAGLCTGMAGAPFSPDCEGGFPIQIKLTVEAGTERVDVVRTLRLRFDPAMSANANPVLTPALAKMVAVIEGGERSIEDLVNPTVTLTRDVETTVRIPALMEDAAESYQGLDDEGRPATLRERLTLSWFVESGDIDFDRTAFIEGLEPITDTRENRWTPAKVRDEDPLLDTSVVIVVIRDNRGGVEWAEGRVRIGVAP